MNVDNVPDRGIVRPDLAFQNAKRFSEQCQSASCAFNADRHLLIGFCPFRACAREMKARSCPTSDEDVFTRDCVCSRNVGGLLFVEAGIGHALGSQVYHILLTGSLPGNYRRSGTSNWVRD